MEPNNYNQFIQSLARHNAAMAHMMRTGEIKMPHQFTDEEVKEINSDEEDNNG